jgi:AraC-like DNA-binding protein
MSRNASSREAAPRVSELSSILGVSRAHLTDLAVAELHEPPSTFLKRMQVARALHLMQRTDFSLTRIAYMCGFGTRRTLFRTFRRVEHRSPGSIRRRNVSSG